MAVSTFCLIPLADIRAESIFQSLDGAAAFAPDGGTALAKNLTETKVVPEGGTVARTLGSLPQWGYIAFWFGQPAPAGKVIVRFKVYVDDSDTAAFGIYTKSTSEQVLITKLEIPADAKKNAYVTIDVPVDSKEDWSGLILKKMEASDKPSPWIASVSTVLP